MRQGRQSFTDSWIFWKEWMKKEYECQMKPTGSKHVSRKSLSISWAVELLARDATSLQWSNTEQKHHTHPSHSQKKSPLRTAKHLQFWKSLSCRSIETSIAAGKSSSQISFDFPDTSSWSLSEYWFVLTWGNREHLSVM